MCIQKKNTFQDRKKVSSKRRNLSSDKKKKTIVKKICSLKKEPQADEIKTINVEKTNNKKKSIHNNEVPYIQFIDNEVVRVKEAINNDKSTEMTTEIQNAEPLFKKSVGIQYDKYTYLDIFYHKYYKEKLQEIYGIFCPKFEDFISKNHSLYLKMLPYFEILLDMTMFFEKNVNPLIYTKNVYWRGIETLKKTTFMIVGEKGTGKSSFANKLLTIENKKNDIKIPSQNSINFIYYKLKEKKWQCPYENKYIELTKWGSGLGETFTKNNKLIHYKEDNKFLDEYNIIDCSTFECKVNKLGNTNKTFTETENVTSNHSLLKLNNTSIKNNETISINEINEILLNRVDFITIIIDNKKFSPTLKNLIESVTTYSKKVLFILNHSDKAKSQKELELKKEILRWYIMDKGNSNMSVKIHCSSLIEKCPVKEVKQFIDSEMKKIHQWLHFYKATTINYRVEDIFKDFKNSVSQLLMLFIMSRKDKRFLNKDENEYQIYINEAQHLANMNNLPFDGEFIKQSFTYTELPPEQKCAITMFNSDWKNLPTIEYFIDDEKHLDKN